jgi:hypothetical protein
MSAPFGMSFLIALLPGPCTTFDDVTPPDAGSVDTDSDVSDSIDASIDCGLVIDFAAGTDCQQRFNSEPECCQDAYLCTKNPGCSAWFNCANKCPPPRGNSACLKACGDTGADSGFQEAFNQIAGCRSSFADSSLSGCEYP